MNFVMRRQTVSRFDRTARSRKNGKEFDESHSCGIKENKIISKDRRDLPRCICANMTGVRGSKHPLKKVLQEILEPINEYGRCPE